MDLGAAGKGAACDAALQAYRDAGVDNAVIAVGGSIGVMGRRLTQENWRISVRDPDKSVDDSDAGMGVLELSEGFCFHQRRLRKTISNRMGSFIIIF